MQSTKKNMTRTFSILTITTLLVSLIACKPAAEDRVKMHENAKRVSDSIARTIDVPLNEVMPEALTPAAVDTTKK
jgi:hypothetical protein